jgi:hypothetical protein
MTNKSKTTATAGRPDAIDRRRLLKSAAGAAALACLPGRIWAAEAPAILPVKNPNSKLQVAIVGLGGISGGHIANASKHEHLVALCECYPERTEAKIEWMKSKLTDMNVKPEDMKKYLDYREMLEDMDGKIDAVQVCTPDHNHAIIGMDCIQRGIHIFIEKPMAYSIHEAFALREAARKHRVAAQMGNEGHSWGSIRRAVEYLQAGAIGPVHEVHHWCVGRAIGGDHTGMVWTPMKYMRPEFELWSVPVPEEEAYRTLSGGNPDPEPLAKPNGGDRRWHNGTLGDWAPHTMDAAYWGLKIDQAPTCKIEMLDRRWGGDKLHYKMEVFQWTIPERAGMPELKQYWYSGVKPNTDRSLKD